jgi:hypothetical protein
MQVPLRFVLVPTRSFSYPPCNCLLESVQVLFYQYLNKTFLKFLSSSSCKELYMEQHLWAADFFQFFHGADRARQTNPVQILGALQDARSFAICL